MTSPASGWIPAGFTEVVLGEGIGFAWRIAERDKGGWRPGRENRDLSPSVPH